MLCVCTEVFCVCNSMYYVQRVERKLCLGGIELHFRKAMYYYYYLFINYCKGGDGLAQWLEPWTGDPKVEGLNLVRSTSKT